MKQRELSNWQVLMWVFSRIPSVIQSLVFLWQFRHDTRPAVLKLIPALKHQIRTDLTLIGILFLSLAMLGLVAAEMLGTWRNDNARFEIEQQVRAHHRDLPDVLAAWDACYDSKMRLLRPDDQWLRCDFQVLSFASERHLAARFTAYVRERDAALANAGIFRYPSKL